ncbi:MAG TPA: N-6 DNA methylase [Selenomonadales bacterium]|nr:N-6 DNA methylase [Selenomonadales bacterium]
METATRRGLRDLAAQLRALLEEGCAALGLKDSSAQAWYGAMYLALQKSMEVRGITGAPPVFLAIARVAPETLPAALLQPCRRLLDEEKAAFAAPAALAWFHQYWHDTERQAMTARLRQDAKIGSGEVAAATQVYTEAYMAEYLIQNSLGALWMSLRPESPLAADWRYFIRDRDKTGRLPARPASTLSVLDPACGSGNLLLVAFDLLYRMYEDEGEEDPAVICAAILNRNLYGLDIDARAIEVARAVLWLRAKEKAPGLGADEPAGLGRHILPANCGGVEADLGSLARVSARPAGQPDFAALLNRTYDVVVTNPPYLDKRDYSRPVRDYLRRHYSAGAGNLYTAFLLRCLELAEHFTGLVTPQTFLYIRHYAKLRRAIFQEAHIRTLAHLGLGAFTGVVVDVALFVLAKRTAGQSDRGVYFKLLGAADKQAALLGAVARYNAGESGNEAFVRSLTEATALAGAPVIYWLGEKTLGVLKSARPLADIADVVLGMKTSDNRRFVRLWWELPPDGCSGWLPYEKEASGYRYRRNSAHYVRWTPEAQAFYKRHYSAQLPNVRYWLRPGIVYGLISSKAFTAKLLPAGHMSDMAASCIYPRDGASTLCLLALLNSKIYQWLLKGFNPTVNYQPADVKRLPVPDIPAWEIMTLERLGELAATAAGTLREMEITDRAYRYNPRSFLPLRQKLPGLVRSIWRRCLEYLLAAGAVDERLARIFNLPAAEYRAVMREMGRPASTFPVLTGYDGFPAEWPEVLKGLPESRIAAGPEELAGIKRRLKELYSAGPLPGQLPEVFFEGLALELGLHPVTVFNLMLEGIRSEGWTGKLEKRLTEDFFSAAVLTLMGHRWPGRESAGVGRGEPPGILFVGPGAFRPTALGALHAAFAAEGVDPAAAEQAFAAVTGVELADWLANSFFKRHLAQFKKRPVVWQIAGPGRAAAPLGCLVHGQRAGILAELGAYLSELSAGADEVGGQGSVPEEWRRFQARLELLRQYRIDPALGVGINIAPVQQAGLLAAEVLTGGELKRALAIYREWRDGTSDYLL